MKNDRQEKAKQAMSDMWKKTTDISKKTAAEVSKGAKKVGTKIKEESIQWKKKKYNPVFPETYQSPDFKLPNIIMIRDDAERRGIDVCEGAIGWLTNDTSAEVFCLYDEAVEMSGLQFIPTADCNAMYYVDSFDRKKFIRIDHIFKRAHEERMAELKHIAYSLGAKKCTIEISEADMIANQNNKSFSTKETATIWGVTVSKGDQAEVHVSSKNNRSRKGKIVLEFEGSSTPQKPELKWFANDDNIKRLIEMRCQPGNSLKTECLELSGTTSATMSVKTACTIDVAVRKNQTHSTSTVENEAQRENSSIMIYNIEF